MRNLSCITLAFALGACASPETLVRLDVQYEESYALDALELAAGDDLSRVGATHEVLVRLPDSAADVPLTIRVTGLREEVAVAEGSVTVTPRLGLEVVARVTLARLPCGAGCDEGDVRCGDSGVERCGLDADGCSAWEEATPCPSEAPFCSDGVCGSECADECATDETECTGARIRRACGQRDADPCRDWLAEELCPMGSVCAAGSCTTDCTTECTLGAVACRDGGQVRCAEVAEGCFRFGPVDPCDAPPSPTECYVAIGTCEGEGSCAYAPDDGAPCDDGDLLTVNDVCMSGACAGELRPRTWVEVESSDGHTCARRDSGTVVCWGVNADGQLGRGTTSEGEPTPAAVLDLTDAIQLAAGANHTCAVRAGGTVVCWGSNRYGQLGLGATASTTRPTAVGGLTSVAQLHAGDLHTCARTTAGAVYCWGANVQRQIGDGTTDERRTPVLAMASGAVDLDGGDNHNCIRTADGGAACWGYNTDGQLGDGTTEDRSAPVVVPGLTTVAEITGGFSHTCARLDDGTVACWGANEELQSGGSSTADILAPRAMAGLAGVSDIDLGSDHTCAVTGGLVRCWGDGFIGQLGDGGTSGSSVPLTASGLTDALAVTTGSFHTCALLASDGIACWGTNFEGQLGDGTTTNRRVPTAVLLPDP